MFTIWQENNQWDIFYFRMKITQLLKNKCLNNGEKTSNFIFILKLFLIWFLQNQEDKKFFDYFISTKQW